MTVAPSLNKANLLQMQLWAEATMGSRPRDVLIGSLSDPYIERWWIIPPNKWSNVYLHHVRRSDDERALHDHPWPNTSFLISGSYIEHTPEGTFVREAGDVVTRAADALHRLEVIPGERAISLFMTGPKVREWGFACEHGWVHWRDFVNEANPSLIGRGCGEHGDLSPVTRIGQPRAGRAS